ncbi:hypothetical protein [Alteromonas sp. ASW11-130]|uniref:hypothetical protein n=1 Tax=Alteromonas sp. ASW11-130 TaxID=3015775 RepID=UPI0022429FCD|nr:hypothetical protein [Alteromonas sp. ASW11-130]MCW8092774.1 hypothetical protein [Alteromonas sp. ASW11-130]
MSTPKEPEKLISDALSRHAAVKRLNVLCACFEVLNSTPLTLSELLTNITLWEKRLGLLEDDFDYSPPHTSFVSMWPATTYSAAIEALDNAIEYVYPEHVGFRECSTLKQSARDLLELDLLALDEHILFQLEVELKQVEKLRHNWLLEQSQRYSDPVEQADLAVCCAIYIALRSDSPFQLQNEGVMESGRFPRPPTHPIPPELVRINTPNPTLRTMASIHGGGWLTHPNSAQSVLGALAYSVENFRYELAKKDELIPQLSHIPSEYNSEPSALVQHLREWHGLAPIQVPAKQYNPIVNYFNIAQPQPAISLNTLWLRYITRKHPMLAGLEHLFKTPREVWELLHNDGKTFAQAGLCLWRTIYNRLRIVDTMPVDGKAIFMDTGQFSRAAPILLHATKVVKHNLTATDLSPLINFSINRLRLKHEPNIDQSIDYNAVLTGVVLLSIVAVPFVGTPAAGLVWIGGVMLEVQGLFELNQLKNDVTRFIQLNRIGDAEEAYSVIHPSLERLDKAENNFIDIAMLLASVGLTMVGGSYSIVNLLKRHTRTVAASALNRTERFSTKSVRNNTETLKENRHVTQDIPSTGEAEHEFLEWYQSSGSQFFPLNRNTFIKNIKKSDKQFQNTHIREEELKALIKSNSDIYQFWLHFKKMSKFKDADDAHKYFSALDNKPVRSHSENRELERYNKYKHIHVPTNAHEQRLYFEPDTRDNQWVRYSGTEAGRSTTFSHSGFRGLFQNLAPDVKFKRSMRTQLGFKTPKAETQFHYWATSSPPRAKWGTNGERLYRVYITERDFDHVLPTQHAKALRRIGKTYESVWLTRDKIVVGHRFDVKYFARILAKIEALDHAVLLKKGITPQEVTTIRAELINMFNNDVDNYVPEFSLDGIRRGSKSTKLHQLVVFEPEEYTPEYAQQLVPEPFSQIIENQLAATDTNRFIFDPTFVNRMVKEEPIGLKTLHAVLKKRIQLLASQGVTEHTTAHQVIEIIENNVVRHRMQLGRLPMVPESLEMHSYWDGLRRR